MIRRLALTLLTVLVLTLAGHAAPARAASGALPVRVVSTSDSVKTQHVKVDWRGDKKERTYTKTALIPGIGNLDLVCKPDETRIRLYTSNRQYETQMWMQKFEDKPFGKAVAVKNARIYRYQDADDPGEGGTGYYANEGLNQKPSIENRSQDGYMYGVISQRSSRKRTAQDAQIGSPRPVTTFELSWNWNGFDHPLKYRSCTIDARFTTHLDDERIGLTWHGESDPAPTTDSTAVSGIGTVDLSCPHERSEPATLSITPSSAEGSVYVERVQGEGKVSDQRDTYTQDYDPETGTLGPAIPLPGNGSLRLHVVRGDVDRWFMLSSVMKRNDPTGRLNLCEVAAGSYQR